MTGEGDDEGREDGRCGERHRADAAHPSQEDRFVQLEQAYNNTPRKCLGYRTPASVCVGAGSPRE